MTNPFVWLKVTAEIAVLFPKSSTPNGGNGPNGSAPIDTDPPVIAIGSANAVGVVNPSVTPQTRTTRAIFIDVSLCSVASHRHAR
jgi:hypothetical protein